MAYVVFDDFPILTLFTFDCRISQQFWRMAVARYVRLKLSLVSQMTSIHLARTRINKYMIRIISIHPQNVFKVSVNVDKLLKSVWNIFFLLPSPYQLIIYSGIGTRVVMTLSAFSHFGGNSLMTTRLVRANLWSSSCWEYVCTYT